MDPCSVTASNVTPGLGFPILKLGLVDHRLSLVKDICRHLIQLFSILDMEIEVQEFIELM